MIAFSRNVPQTALTFGKYSTSGPIRLLASFWKGAEAVEAGRGATRAYDVCLSRPQTTGPENPRTPALWRPRSSEHPGYLHLRGVEMKGNQGRDADSGRRAFPQEELKESLACLGSTTNHQARLTWMDPHLRDQASCSRI